MDVADIAEYLGVTRQRVHQLVPTPGFPAPVTEVVSREWDPTEIEAWADRAWWDTKPWRGRPAASARPMNTATGSETATHDASTSSSVILSSPSDPSFGERGPRR